MNLPFRPEEAFMQPPTNPITRRLYESETCPICTPPSVVAQISQLPGLDMQKIKVLWKRLLGGDILAHNRPFLERRIAYQLQLIEFRKMDHNLLESNQHRIEALVRNSRLKQRVKDHPLPVGTILTRLYHEVEHCVVVVADGQYAYQGSLSVIAREIPGTRWSEP
ncbi:DUF2924 domain-containing protein [Candidatus Nitrotoga fabula]|uniref:Uncharacterized protein n=1 Tax=Candidatus Nitrotoga fabula TaxID=2182327 RepID=A0A916F9E9_9PROT|nr:DUF2924 domain-containing protein [Candidatus Nitrotoga fabula]CAE6690987.1 conserved hypothetical protein [Candidatus Nitrotoga fabula]